MYKVYRKTIDYVYIKVDFKIVTSNDERYFIVIKELIPQEDVKGCAPDNVDSKHLKQI